MALCARSTQVLTGPTLPAGCTGKVDAVLLIRGLLCTAVGRRDGRVVALAVGRGAAGAVRRLLRARGVPGHPRLPGTDPTQSG